MIEIEGTQPSLLQTTWVFQVLKFKAVKYIFISEQRKLDKSYEI